MAGAWAPWRKPCAPGDIVWCHFPQWPDAGPGPKPRPALVCATLLQDDGLVASVAYGTSQRVGRLLAGEFAIVKALHPAAFELAGLSFDTKFDFNAIVALPWTEQFFKPPPRTLHGLTPTLGALHPSLMRAAKAAHEAAQRR